MTDSMVSIFFSIIIPLYNKAKYIENTIQSVLKQTFKNFEVIVVDDGSTDDGPEKVGLISDCRIRLIRKENGGVSSARNRGIAEARGEYIAFLDADDEWRPHALKTFYDFLSTHDCQWAVSGYTRRYKGREKDLIFSKTQIVSDTLIALAAGMSIWTGAVVVKKSCFMPDMLFDTKVSRSEDREVWLKLACRHPRVGYIGEALAVYCIGNPGSLTKTAFGREQYEFLSFEKRLENFLDPLPEYRKEFFSKYLVQFNRKALLSIWISNSKFLKNNNKLFESYFKKLEIYFFYMFNFFPLSIKKFFNKIYFLF